MLIDFLLSKDPNNFPLTTPKIKISHVLLSTYHTPYSPSSCPYPLLWTATHQPFVRYPSLAPTYLAVMRVPNLHLQDRTITRKDKRRIPLPMGKSCPSGLLGPAYVMYACGIMMIADEQYETTVGDQVYQTGEILQLPLTCEFRRQAVCRADGRLRTFYPLRS